MANLKHESEPLTTPENGTLSNGHDKILMNKDDEVHVSKLPLTKMQKFKNVMKDNMFMIATIIGVIIGFVLGFGIRMTDPSDTGILWLKTPGDLFIRLLKMTILPLIAANVIVVTSSLDPKVNGKISMVAFGYIIAANVASAILGMSCALVIKPGNMNMANSTSNSTARKVASLTTSDVFHDLLENLLPDNIVGASIYMTTTTYNNGKRSTRQNPSVNMIGILFIAFIFGMAARMIKAKGEPLLAFFRSLADVVVQIMRWFLWLTPIGVCFMIAGSVAELKNIGETFSNLGLFILTVTAALGIHFFISNLILFAVSRTNPFKVVPPAFQSWFISFATTSPIVAIPEMYECCDKLKIPASVSRFVIPFAAALKGDGSACFVCCATVFVGQLSGDPLNIGTLVVICILTASAMMALPNIPSASIVIIITVLTSVGIDEQYVGLLYAVEWILDRMRSGTIGLSHIYCTAVTYHICKNDIKQNEELLKSKAIEDDLEMNDMKSKDPVMA